MFNHKSLAAVIVSAMLAACCGSSSTAPTSPVVPRAPIALSGQSNAQFVAPFLTAAYAGPVAVSATYGTPIAYWDWTDSGSSGANWRALEPYLTPTLSALVWWQGESDGDNPTYAAVLAGLFAHIRQVAQRPALRIVIVQVEDVPELQGVRAIQAAYVASDRYSVLVSTDGAELKPGEVHLTDAGYQMMTSRILAALQP